MARRRKPRARRAPSRKTRKPRKVVRAVSAPPPYVGWAPPAPATRSRKRTRPERTPDERAAELRRAAGRDVEPERDLAENDRPMGTTIRDAAVAARLRFKEVRRGRTYRDRETGRMVKAANVKRAISTARNAAAVRYYAVEKGLSYSEARTELSARWKAIKAERKRLAAEVSGLRKMGLPLDREALKRLRSLPGSFEGTVRAETSPKKKGQTR